MATNNQITPSQLATPLVDQRMLITRQWLNFFQQVSETIRTTIINNVTVNNLSVAQIFDAISLLDPALIPDNMSELCGDTIIDPASSAPGMIDQSVIHQIIQDALASMDGHREPSPQNLSIPEAAAAVPQPWEPFTTAVTPAGAMTYTPTSQDTAADLFGDTVSLRMALVGTVGGTPDLSLAVTLPYAAYGIQSIAGYAIMGSINVPILGAINGTTATVSTYDNLAFSAGGLTLVLTGTYQAA